MPRRVQLPVCGGAIKAETAEPALRFVCRASRVVVWRSSRPLRRTMPAASPVVAGQFSIGRPEFHVDVFPVRSVRRVRAEFDPFTCEPQTPGRRPGEAVN
jgi:hypothetical protein